MCRMVDNQRICIIFISFSYCHIHTLTMSAVRKTISLPPAVAKQLDQEARRRKTSVSALVTELVSRPPQTLPYAGLIDDDEDLSLRVEEILSRLPQ